MKRNTILRTLSYTIGLVLFAILATSCTQVASNDSLPTATTRGTTEQTRTAVHHPTEAAKETTIATETMVKETTPTTEIKETEPENTPETDLVASALSYERALYCKRSIYVGNSTGGKTELPAGTLLLEVDVFLDDDSNVWLRFETIEGATWKIPVEIDGETVWIQGHYYSTLLGGTEEMTVPTYPIPEEPGRDVVQSIEDILYRPYYYGSITYWCDWNQDGVTDKLMFDNRGEGTIVFRNGTTLEEIVLDGIFKESDEAIMLCENSRGELAILLLENFCCGSEPTVYFVYQYDPDLKFVSADEDCYAYQGFFDYRGGEFSCGSNGSSFPGNCWFVEHPAVLNDDFCLKADYSTGTYVGGWSKFSYTKVDAPAQLWNGRAYEDVIIPVGTVFFPVRYEFMEIQEEMQTGYFYLKTLDGTTYRVTLEQSLTESSVLLAGLSQDDFCYCQWGG